MKNPLVAPCREWAERLAMAHSADLSLADRQALETHIASCPACHAVLKEYQALDERLHRALPAQEVSSISATLLSAEKNTDVSKEKGHRATVYHRRGSRPLQRVSSFGKLFNALAAILVVSLLVGGFWALSVARHRPDTAGATGAPGSTATSIAPSPPSSVKLRVNTPGTSPTAQGEITIPAGTTVTLTVVPDHSLLPFQTFTMGIYATDPFPFSELQYCKYPNTSTCSYVIAYSSSENTDYTHGKHTFRAFLGEIGGAILANSSSVTITWS